MNTIPFSEEYEKALLVGILADPSLLPKVSLQVEPEDFWLQRHRDIYKTITSLDVENIDSLVVEESISDPEVKEYFKGLVRDSDSMLPGLSNILYYAETIKAKSKLRDGIDLGREIIALCYEDNVDVTDAQVKLEGMFSKFLRARVTEATYESTKQAFNEFVESLGVRITDTTGTKTGYTSIDLILHKLEGMIVLAGRPGLGKTAFACNIARNVGKEKPVLFFSLEQPREQIFERILAAESGVPLEDIRTGAFVGNQNHVEMIDAAKDSLNDLFNRVHVDDTSAVSSSYIASVSRQKYFEQGEIGLIVVDYLHIMKLDAGSLVESLGTAVKDLRALGRELGCPVLLLSQLSRQPESQADGEKKVRRRPELSDLRSSGEIEQSADVVMFLHRESYYNMSGHVADVDPVEVIVKKNRNGRTGMTQLNWFPAVMKYDEPEFAQAPSMEDDFTW